MKKLNLAIIGQGRSGRNIHGAFLKKEENIWYNVVAVAELDPERRARAEAEYPGCKAYEDFHDLIARDDIDLIVNASYSEMHYSITKECLLGGKNVLVEKPFGRNYYECCDLMNTAKEMGVTLAVFQQSLYAPYYAEVKKIIDSGILGDIVQINLRNNGFARRWDWQTTQKKMGGSVYNTGDMGWRDGDGYIWFTGRNDDVIKCSGYRIGPFEVESALHTHPSVLECAVTAVPDPVRGQVVKATIVLSKGYVASDALTKELQQHVKMVTAPYKYPRIIEYVKELPKTTSGKIKRSDIRNADVKKEWKK